MAKTQKIIITAAVTGATHTPSLSPYFPATPQQIIADAVTAPVRLGQKSQASSRTRSLPAR